MVGRCLTKVSLRCWNRQSICLHPLNCIASLNCACCKLGSRRVSIAITMWAHYSPKQRKRCRH
ncbi:Uncharacterised protein [Vibrio cholerae]|nr:Uncharacterised protein [Vibrio cholerae]